MRTKKKILFYTYGKIKLQGHIQHNQSGWDTAVCGRAERIYHNPLDVSINLLPWSYYKKLASIFFLLSPPHFFWPHHRHVKVPGAMLEFTLRLQATPQLRQCCIFNPLCLVGASNWHLRNKTKSLTCYATVGTPKQLNILTTLKPLFLKKQTQ